MIGLQRLFIPTSARFLLILHESFRVTTQLR